MIVSAGIPFALARIIAPDVKADPLTHLRPPGALKDDEAFINACIGCGLCERSCIQIPQAIKILPRKSS